MKTRTWIFLFVLLLLLCGGLSVYLFHSGSAVGVDARFAEISSHGEVIATVALHLDRELTVKNGDSYNVVSVKDGKIAVTEASCPDHYCMHRGFCNSGPEIVCLPNRLVIRFLGEQTVDAMVG